jgi:hypothetical protein
MRLISAGGRETLHLPDDKDLRASGLFEMFNSFITYDTRHFPIISKRLYIITIEELDDH